MYSDGVVTVALGILIIWLGALSFLIWQQGQFFKSLFPKTGERDIRKKFAEIIQEIEEFKGKLTSLEDKLQQIQKQGLEHIQRVEFLRFNPYEDTGGNISFTACFLDDKGTGIVITSLHARSGTRVFGKEIVLGKSKKFELSKEEQAVINKAMTKKYE